MNFCIGVKQSSVKNDPETYIRISLYDKEQRGCQNISFDATPFSVYRENEKDLFYHQLRCFPSLHLDTNAG